MAEELATLEHTSTWDIFPLPHHVRPITYKWVYKVKTHFDGSLEYYKAHLVAHGFQQEHCHDYDETFFPVAHMTTICTILVVAASTRFDIFPLPHHVRPITYKWVYKVKTRFDGSLEYYKAHLVVHGFQQEHCHDYDETFFPVAHMTTVCTILVSASTSVVYFSA
ncbi:hypothetical protein GUJ93_ZPchr0004g38860 [Zizania palustris]|uniref:Reverse transcriptase Ty1/copia-type domain-containing protein n=1 Tax=Zizania palustris TaxID=103762 RepID=A0A8J5T0I6_ZIZPA|nr:hypothetical protein GUJ93_ZPchr0004g38860 [Zizania palustris]